MSGAIPTDRNLYEEDHEAFRETVRAFVDKHAAPNAERWGREGKVDRWLFTEAAKAGVLGFNIPEEFGGGGTRDFRFNAILGEELARHPVSDGLAGVGLSNDIVIPYFTDLTDDEQKRRWLPGIAAGELVVAVAMTEPGTGSDLSGIRTSAVRDGDDYVVNGSKVFISNGQNADLIVTAVRTGQTLTRASASSSSRPTARASSVAATWRRSACTRRTPASSSSRTYASRWPTCSERRAAGSSA